MSAEVTELNARARGWLRHLWDKATTPDDWSSSGEPHEWWDRNSSAPMCAFPRFDLGESAYALPLMCEVTPAWREVYTRIARELCERHMTFWAAIDALVLIGEDPNVDRYPPEWQIYVPERLRGAYAPPGWIGNGDERWGLNPDPIAADGNACDGEEFTAWRAAGANAIELDLTTGDHALVVRTGYHGRGVEVAREHATATRAVVSGSPAAPPSAAAIAAVASCRCC